MLDNTRFYADKEINMKINKLSDVVSIRLKTILPGKAVTILYFHHSQSSDSPCATPPSHLIPLIDEIVRQKQV